LIGEPREEENNFRFLSLFPYTEIEFGPGKIVRVIGKIWKISWR
jgi:hypothetical protein